jgi:hypothetical protein
MDLKETTRLLASLSSPKYPPDKEHFGNRILITTRGPLAIRVTDDRGVVLDLMELEAFQAGAIEPDWFNWEVVARA